MSLDSDVVLIFDLDDTLYKECTYSYSCFEFVCAEITARTGCVYNADTLVALKSSGEVNPILRLCLNVGLKEIDCNEIVLSMQSHKPRISLSQDAAHLLQNLRQANLPFGIITDGRSATQRAKIEALGVSDAAIILISEEQKISKPNIGAFEPVTDLFSDRHLVYVADNPRKDFVSPNCLGWTTIMLVDDGRNIHSQNIAVDIEYRAIHCVNSLREIEKLLNPRSVI